MSATLAFNRVVIVARHQKTALDIFQVHHRATKLFKIFLRSVVEPDLHKHH